MGYFCGVEKMRGGRPRVRGVSRGSRGVSPGGRGVSRNLALCGRVPPAHAKGVGLEALEGRRLFDVVALDPAFGAGGKSRIDVADLADYAAAVHRLADGKLLVAGSATWGTDANASPIRRAFVARLTADGALDVTFGTNGIATYQPSVPTDPQPSVFRPFLADVNALAVGPDGRIFVGGSTRSLTPPLTPQGVPIDTTFRDPMFAVAAFTADGGPDDGFGENGVVWFPVEYQTTGGEEAVDALAVQPDGKLVAVGTVQQAGAEGVVGRAVGVVAAEDERAGAAGPRLGQHYHLAVGLQGNGSV